MKILCSGAGPAGLYFSLLLKNFLPDCEIIIHERQQPRLTTGWGVILHNDLLNSMYINDIASYKKINGCLQKLSGINITSDSENVLLPEYSFNSISRAKLISILQERCEDLGVNIVYNSDFDINSIDVEDYSLVVLADGHNSTNRNKLFSLDNNNTIIGENKYIWLGLDGSLDESFNFIFIDTGKGIIWAHNYRYDERHSTFVVEMSLETWCNLDFDKLEYSDAVDKIQNLFQHKIHNLKIIKAKNISNFWLNYNHVNSKNWFINNTVLLGNSAHNAHFSIGSGTRLAIDDAICLANLIKSSQYIDEMVLSNYENQRKDVSYKLKEYANNSMTWFERIPTELIESDIHLFAQMLKNRAKLLKNNIDYS